MALYGCANSPAEFSAHDNKINQYHYGLIPEPCCCFIFVIALLTLAGRRKDIMSLTIRRATIKDSDDLLKIAEIAYDKYLPLMDKKPAPMLADFNKHIAEDIVFIALAEVEIIAGYVVLQQIKGQWWLDNIAVHPNHQGQGIGTKLRIEAENYVSILSDTIQLYTNIVMADNISWYERAGYVITQQALINGYERLYFEKRLS